MFNGVYGFCRKEGEFMVFVMGFQSIRLTLISYTFREFYTALNFSSLMFYKGNQRGLCLKAVKYNWFQAEAYLLSPKFLFLIAHLWCDQVTGWPSWMCWCVVCGDWYCCYSPTALPFFAGFWPSRATASRSWLPLGLDVEILQVPGLHLLLSPLIH